jgi:hypothetical protein
MIFVWVLQTIEVWYEMICLKPTLGISYRFPAQEASKDCEFPTPLKGTACSQIQPSTTTVPLAEEAMCPHGPESTWHLKSNFLQYLLKERLAPISRLASLPLNYFSLLIK